MRYKIVLVPFPFDDFSETKVPPAVCLTDKIGPYNHILIAFITSQAPSTNIDSDIPLKKGDETGLKINSLLRLHRLTTVPVELIKRQLGQAPSAKRAEIQQQLLNLFGIKGR